MTETPMTPAVDVQRLKELAEKATPGPWTLDGPHSVWKVNGGVAKIADAIEAERDALQEQLNGRHDWLDVLQTRLDAVLSVCDAASGDHIAGVSVVRVPLVRAAARGGQE